ncbi:MAG: phospholipid carrier-dependent glycosyltransferase, partial [Chloroflexi bacterium]|nr:phospholipid carrier-dependent glycosyltransferase [Chloroflexota bacterium]
MPYFSASRTDRATASRRTQMNLTEVTSDSLLDRVLSRRSAISIEMVLVLAILLLAVASRFYMLGARVMSHDEVNHVVPAYDLYQGRGYRYDPMSHGPLQFHLMAWSYFLFGDSDLTSRLPHALFSVATVVAILFLYHRYLGRAGALLAGFMVLISPYMLFYGRYARNEAFIMLWGALTLYAILRYLESGESWVLFLFTAVNAFHFIDKATSYIFAGEQLLFLGGYLVCRISGRNWQNEKKRRQFLILLGVTVALTALVLGMGLGGEAVLILLVAGVLACGTAAVLTLVWGVSWDTIRKERSFDLLILLVTLILPLLAALPVKVLGFSPLDTSSAGIVRAMAIFLSLALLAMAGGLWWNPSRW